MKSKLLPILLLVLCGFNLNGQSILKETVGDETSYKYETHIYAHRDTCDLKMLVFRNEDSSQPHPCIIFVYGGGFSSNNLMSNSTLSYCDRLRKDGFTAIAIDYRLGMKNIVSKGVLSMIRPTQNAIHIAAEDLLDATKYIIENALSLNVDISKIITSGSSAGAITVLQADYELCNRTEITDGIPADFRYAGVMSFAGAIFSTEGQPEYKVHSPAPTLMMHGTADVLVNYKAIRFFNLGFFGSSKLVKSFEKNDYPYCFLRFTDQGHTVAMYYLNQYDLSMWFINNMVFERNNYHIDATIDDRDYHPASFDRIGPNGLYK